MQYSNRITKRIALAVIISVIVISIAFFFLNGAWAKPTTVPYTPAATTMSPPAAPTTATPKTPAFEAIFAITALLIAIPVRRR